MTKVAVISPHCDDAAFSVAEHMLSREQDSFTIMCPLNGIPTYGKGIEKHQTLLEEHVAVCRAGRWARIDGEYLDDVYKDDHTIDDLDRWFRARQLGDYDQVWLPAGIHHPDHVMVREACDMAIRHVGASVKRFMYEELPYRVLYPELAITVVNFYPHLPDLVGYDPKVLTRKKELCRMYASQVDAQLERHIYATERLWPLR